jgi:hypothetical protein
MSQFSSSWSQSSNLPRFTAWIYGLGLLLIAIAPLLPNHYPPWVGFHHEAAAFAGWLALTISIALGARDSLRVPVAAIVPLLISCILWLQYLFGQIPFAGDATTGATYLVCSSAMIIAGANLGRARDKGLDVFAHVLWVLVLSALASSALALVQWLRQEELIGLFISNVAPSGRPYANLNQPNHLATYILLGLCAAVYLYERYKINGLVLAMLSAMSLMTLLMTESRAAMISLGTLIGWLMFMRRSVRMRLRLLPIVIWVAVLGLSWSSWSSICEFLLLDQSRKTSFVNSNGRIHMWSQIIHGVLKAPWLGFGWHETSAAQLAGSTAVPSLYGQSLTDFSHNLFLDLIVWFGIPIGLFLSVCFLFWFLRRLMSGEADLDKMCACALCLPILAHSMFEYPYAYSYFLMPFCFFLGCMERGVRGSAIAFDAKFGIIVLAFLALMMSYMLVEYMAAEEDYRIQRYETLRVGKRPDGYTVSPIFIQTQLAAGLEAARFEPRENMSMEEIERVRDFTRRFLSAELLIKYAQALQLNGMHEEAKFALNELQNTYGLKWGVRGAQALGLAAGSE